MSRFFYFLDHHWYELVACVYFSLNVSQCQGA